MSVSTIAKPEKMAPATKYGGKIVVCQPGMTEVAKSQLTIVCTDTTSGVARPASRRYSVSYRAHVRFEPVHPRLKNPVRARFTFVVARSRMVAKSGMSPTYQNTSEIVKYVPIANMSHTSGERKLIQSGPRVLGYGSTQNASHGRPMWMMGKIPAQITAKIVIASADRLTEVRHFWRKRNRMAEMSVPACPMPIQKTKLVMSNAQPTVLLRPQVPIPVTSW